MLVAMRTLSRATTTREVSAVTVSLYIFKANYNYIILFKYYTFISLYISIIFIVLR